MSNLRQFTLSNDKKKDDWVLKDAAGRVKERFETKGDATAGGVLANAVGSAGGSVRIHKADGRIQEERTYPGSKDPKKSPG